MEKHMLAVVNETRRLFDGPRLLHHLISTSRGDATAIDFLLSDGTRVSLTYDSFKAASLLLTLRLRQLLSNYGAGRHIIPVLIPQSPELYIAWRAILQAGACVCPIQHDVPPERLKFIVNDVSTDIILCLEHQASRLKSILPNTDCVVVALEDLGHADRAQRPEGLRQSINIRPSDPAYVMYTSGSTGLPKGVIVSHSSITQSLLAHEQHIPLFKRFLQFASPTFDVSLFEIFFPFMRGETLVGSSRETMLADLPGTIITLNADAAELTPTVAGTLLRTRGAAPCLKTLLTIGEMLTKRVVEEFGGSTSRESMLFAMYGPTEAAVHCTVASRLLASSSVRNIGRPLDTVTAFILKETAHPKSPAIALVGESGELTIAGQLADGYLNRTAETRMSFINLPGYGRVYRTGDRARCHSDGTFEIIGRISDGQVKLRGQRVELGEIEEVASKTDDVSMAVATLIDEQIVLFYESQTGTPADQVRSTCKSWLPPFMWPGEVIMLTEGFPRLPSGKVDKKTLEGGHKEKTVQPAMSAENEDSDVERMLAIQLEEVLGRTISTHSDLWSCGLDSLRAISIAARLRQDFPTITINDILECESLADLAAHIREQSHLSLKDVAPQRSRVDDWQTITSVAMEHLPAHTGSVAKIVPCSSMQIAMLTETSASPDLNFNYIKLKTVAHVSYGDVWNALCRLAEGNEILRSGFLFTGLLSMPYVQVVWRGLEIQRLSMLHPLQLVPEDDANSQLPVLRIHHALYDGWSWELILDDLNSILAKQIPPLRPSFEDFTCWQREKSLIDTSRNRQYWNHLLADYVRTPLPSLTSSQQPKPSREAITRTFDLPYSKLSDLCAGLRISRQTLLQACWTILLSTYTDSPDVTFGTVASGRHIPLEGVDRVTGPCLSTLACRVVLSTLRTAKDLLLCLQRQWFESLEHSSISLHDILKSNQGLHEGKLFDHLLVWQEGDRRSPSQRRYVWTAEVKDVLDYIAVLEVEKSKESLQAKLTVSTDKIPVAQAYAMLQQLDYLLSRVASNVEADLPTIWHAGPESIMSVSNPNYAAPRDYGGLTDTIRVLSKEDPTRPALRFVHDFDPSTGDIDITVLSYGELYEKACNVSATLRNEHAIQRDKLVAIIAQKSISLYLAIVGTIMSGAAYVCVDPSTPSDRVSSVLQQAECTVILADDTFDAAKVTMQSPMVKIESVLQPRNQEPGKLSSQYLNDLAYAVFTSGTTGVPKGVLITRKNLLSNISCLSNIYSCNPATDSLLQACSPAFDVSVFEIFWTWNMGMTLCAATNDVLFRNIESLIARLGVTHLSLTPSVAALVNPENVPKVKMLVTAGEPMKSKVFRSWAGNGLYQGYGPSETTNICNVRPNVAPADRQDSVGRAFSNTSVFVCARSTAGPRSDGSHTQAVSVEDFDLLPKGALGEVWIGGEQVGRGYTDKSLTAQSFLDHPSYGRLYRSGDFGRLLDDDSLVILGRTDDQAKIRGQRIELGEINGVLLASNVVRDAFSLVDSRDGSSRLLSFCAVPDPNNPRASQDLAEQMFSNLEVLPSYMVPDAIMFTAELPLTKQGKVNRRELLQAFKAQGRGDGHTFSRHQGQAASPNLDDKELGVAQALCEVVAIDLDAVRRSSSFYAHGLDSINAIHFSQLLVNRGFGRLDVSTILKHPSIKALMPFLKREEKYRTQQRQGDQMSFGPLFDSAWLGRFSERLRTKGLKLQNILPCTDLQQSMLSSSEDANSRAYHNTLRFAVKGDVKRMKRVWTEATVRHDLLGCMFVRCPDSAIPYAQVILKETGLQWRNGEMKLQIPELDEIVPITPFRLSVHQINGKRDELQLDIHHALYDAEAISSLLREVESIYWEQPLSHPCSFESYITYKSSLDTNVIHDFWRRTLTGAVPCRLAERIPGNYAAKKHDSYRASATLRVTLEALQSTAHGQEASVLSVFQCAVARLMFHVFESQDVCFGNVFSGRNLPIEGIDRIVGGPTFNALPIRAQAKRSTSNHQLIGALHELNIQILPLQPSSIRQIQHLCSPDGGRLFDVLLLLQQEQPALDASIWELLEDRGDMSFPFILEISQDHQSNEVRAILHSEVAQGALLESILDCFNDLLQHCVVYPQALAMDFSCIHPNLPFRQLEVQSSSRTPVAQSGRTANDPWSNEQIIVRDLMLRFSPIKKVEVSPQTSLFNMGLDSINAVQIAAQLRKLGYKISSSSILEAPTIFEIAAICTEEAAQPPVNSPGFDFATFDSRCRSSLCQSEGLESSAVESIRPCTATQAGIVSQYLKSNELYFNTIRLKLAHNIDSVRVRESWENAMQRHEMLRTGFAACNVDGYSFAMITYHSRSVRLPWQEGAATNTISSRLSMPPWRLRLSVEDEVAYLDVSMLHALYDAQSLDMILGEAASHYAGEALPTPVDITPTISSILSESDSEDAKWFWQEKHNAIQPTKFPDLNIYKSRKQISTVLTKLVSMPLRDVQHHAARLDCSLQTICQAVWAKLLASYTGQDRVTFGLILSGRDFDDSKSEAAFPCINTVPCSVEVGGDLASILSRISMMNSKLSRFQHTPLTAIKRWQQLEAEPFDTILVLQKFASSQAATTPWSIVEDRASAEYAVSLEVLVDGENDEMVFRATYSEHVLPMEAAEIMLTQLDCLMNDIIHKDQYTVNMEDQSILPAKYELLPSSLRLLHEMVEQTVDRKSDAPALEYVREFDGSRVIMDTWSYAELDAEANRIAHLLIQHGAKTGDMVLVCFDKCPQASAAILGVLKAGCAYVAIDPGAPVDRKKFILQDCGSKIVLTMQEKVADFVKTDHLKVFDVANPAVVGHYPAHRPVLGVPLDPVDTCYCLYTSGTTGQPKGCLISHQSAVQAMLSFERIFHNHWSSESRWLQFASFHFDVSVLEQYWSWYVGIRVTSAPRDLLFEDIPGFIRTIKITHLDLTPSLARLLTPEDVPSLCDGVFIVGGEQVSQDTIDTWGGANCLYNFYGPSEVTIGCTVRPRVTRNTKPTNIGRQWDNVGTYVLEPGTEKPVVRGGVGELCLSGVLVGKGYLNRPELTAKSFVTLKDDGTRVYRTGDLVRLLHDDSFEFLGRMDDQVKLRGQRLEIGEINQVIRSGPSDVKAVATIVTRHPLQGREQLVAFVATTDTRTRESSCSLVTMPGASRLSAKLRRDCMDVLPSFMVPSWILVVNFMPLTVNNKIDNRTLSQLYEDFLDNERSAAKSLATGKEQTKSFQRAAEILADWFGLPKDRIVPESSLFELGLDSITAIGLARRFRASGFAQSTAATVMRNTTVADLVDSLATSDCETSHVEHIVTLSKQAITTFDGKYTDTAAKALEVHADNIEAVVPCTPLQEGMISKVISGEAVDSTYFAQFHYDLKNDVILEKIREAWRLVQESTAVLRTYFVPTGEGFAQVVLKRPSQAAGIEGRDQYWTGNAFGDWIETARSFGRVIPWRLAVSPTWGKTYMTLFIFHGLYDGISLSLLLDKVAQAYASAGEYNTESRFYQILPYGPLRREPVAKAFWCARLPFFRRLNLQANYAPRQPHEPVPRPTKCRLTLPDLPQLCIRLETTPSALFQAAWLLCLEGTYAVNPSLGLVVSGRSIQHDDAETVIFPMLNTVPCTIDGLAEDADLGDLAKACHRFNVDMLPFQHTALRDIAKWTGHDPRNGLLDNLFVYQKESRGHEHDLWKSTASGSVPDYSLNLEVEQKLDGSFGLTLVAKQEYLDSSDKEALLWRLRELLERAANGERVALPEAFKITNTVGGAVPSESSMATSLPDVNDYVVQAGPAARKVQKHFSDLSGLQQNKIGLTRPSLFELGLDSIDVMKLATRLRNDGLTIPISMIMQQPTVGGICRVLEERYVHNQEENRSSPKSTSFDVQQDCYRELLSSQSVELGEVERLLPVSPMQEGLLLDSERYYQVMAFELDFDVDIQRLKRAWTLVIQQQPILRTKFVAVEDSASSDAFIQVIHCPSRSTAVASDDDMRYEALSGAADRIRSLARKEGTGAQTIHIRFLESQRKRLMILGMPHAAYDAWSLNLLHQQISKAYVKDQGDAIEGVAISYEAHLAIALQHASSDENKTFWQNTLRELQPSILQVTTRKKPELGPQFLSRKGNVALSSALTLCKNLGVTMQSLGLTCWTLTLGHYARCLDVCFGLVLSGRTTEGAGSMIFPTFNTVLFRSGLMESETLKDFLRKIHEHAIQVSEHQHFPLREALKLADGRNRQTGMFNTLFTYQKIPETDAEEKKLYHEVDLDMGPENPPYAMNVEMECRDNSLWWTVATQDGVMDREGVETVLVTIEHVLKALLERSDSPVLQKKDGSTSICGLTPITLEPQLKRLATSLDHQRAITDEEHWSDIESNIRQVLAEISQVDLSRVQKGTGFYHLGLDSVSAIKVAGLLKKRGLKIPVSKIIEAQTVKRMATVVEMSSRPEPGRIPAQQQSLEDGLGRYAYILDQYGIVREDVESVHPTAAGQRYMLDLWTKSKGRLYYPSFWLVVEGVTRHEFDQAMASLASKISILRTTFLKDTINSEGSLVQVTFRPETSEQHALPWSYMVQEDDGKFLVKLKLHHALYDAVSLQVTLSELGQLCSGRRAREQERLNTDIEPFLSLTHEIDVSSKIRQRDFWTSYLHLPSSTPARGSFDAPRVERFSSQLFYMSKLNALLMEEGINIQSLFLAICGRVYSRFKSSAGQLQELDSVVIGIYLANRSLDIPDLPSLAASTFNILPLKVRVFGRSGLLQAAREVQDDLVRISRAENCGVSLREIYEWTGKKLDFVVNFLKVPGRVNDERDVEEERDADEGRVRVRLADGEVREKLKFTMKVEEIASPFLNDSAPSEVELEWCIPTIDIEAKVSAGWLGVGVFAPDDMLDENAENGMLHGIRESLESVESMK